MKVKLIFKIHKTLLVTELWAGSCKAWEQQNTETEFSTQAWGLGWGAYKDNGLDSNYSGL